MVAERRPFPWMSALSPSRQAVWLLLIAFLGGVSVHAGPALITVAPAVAGVRSGNTLQLTATTQGTNGPVFWSVNGIPGGNASLGTVSTSGLYTAPLANPGVSLLVTAAITNPVASISAVVGWQNPVPVLTSLSPSTVNAGTFTVAIHGTGFVPGAQVVYNGVWMPPLSVTPNQVVFQATRTNSGSTTVVVYNPAPGGAPSHPLTLRVAQVTVKVAPTTASVRLGTPQTFVPTVGNAVDTGVVWSVNGIPGGTEELGYIGTNGIYLPPVVVPATNIVSVRATSVANSLVSAQSTVTLLSPVAVIAAADPAVLHHGAQEVTLTGTGFVPGSQLTVNGLAVPTLYVSPTEIRATLDVAPTPAGAVAFRVNNPLPGPTTSVLWVESVEHAAPVVSHLAAGRFLEQASWGPDAQDIAHLQSIGFEAWIDEQLQAPVSLHAASTDASNNLSPQQAEFLNQAINGPDPLRQRVAFALGQIFVVSGFKTGQPRQMVPFLNILRAGAFGTYSNLVRQVTLSPTMAMYLDMAFNVKANPVVGTMANENYARELLQLFSIGTILLNADGTPQLDSFGQTIPSYDQTVLGEMSRAFTGWTFPGPALTQGYNPENYVGWMQPVEVNHDTGAKLILGGVELPAGQETWADLDMTLSAVVTHPNVAPFISRRLIQHLVESDPTPEYVGRVSAVFTQTGGDLAQVVRAILLDPEARAGDDPAFEMRAEAGKLREPIRYVLGLLRAFDGGILNPAPVKSLAQVMGQNLFYPASVFSYYSPLYRLPGGQVAPEFQLVSSATALIRANTVFEIFTKNVNGATRVDLNAFLPLASSAPALVDAVDHALLHRRLPAELKSVIVAAIETTSDPLLRTRNAIYLVGTSPLYQIQH
jgi:uncharacterized protein (DUF1800 family)